jgi:dihydroflavonol-4-reductase
VRLYALFDADLRSNLGELGVVKKLDSRDAVALLGRDLIQAETAVVATAESLIAFKLV